MKIGFAVIGALLFILGIGWVAQGNEFFLAKVFSPRMEQVRRETFEQSKAYNQGMAQELVAAQLDYAKATPTEKIAIGSVLLHRYADFDISRLPLDQRTFLDAVRADLIGGAR